MATTILEVNNHLSGMLHAGSSLSKVRNPYHALDRAAKNVLANIKPIDSERETALTSLIYDDVYNYPLPSDFGWLIDLRPQGTRASYEQAARRYAQPFDLKKEIKQRTESIEGRDGTKFFRVNWRTNAPITIDETNAVGDWSEVASATTPVVQKLHKISGNGSLETDITDTGDGIQNTALTTIDVSDEDEQADVFGWIYLPTASDVSNFNSATVIWGNDLTTNYWTSAAEDDQADGTAFKTGWNLLKWSWSDATETGTVDPSEVDSFQITVNVDAAISNIAFDSFVFAVGRSFDIKYYSAYSFKNTSGTYLERPTSNNDSVVFSGTAFEIFLEEARKEYAAQIEGNDSAFDIRFANARLYGNPDSPDPIMRMGLYAKYRAEYPSQTRRPVRMWSNIRTGNYRNV